ncbi:MAG: creatininase family protein [Deltaproteobacteria bacterium]
MAKDTQGVGNLNDLVVIRRLEVGPPRIETNRIKVSYSVLKKNTEDTIDLIYTYPEDVFDPDDANARNLASILSAQVALNYGLFCREMVFHGSLDRADQKFILDMARNTAREIFVKKFLEPNPFIRSDFKGLSPIRQESYLQAEVTFRGEEAPGDGKRGPRHEKGRNGTSRCVAVLSSGGKDSLLSFGLLREMGHEVHPIFVNESGRHWFTALNAFRHFGAHIPHTTKIWTNADRVFNWMLRHLPFVRPDFSKIRSDEYPIRLWTVAVFLFGALPLLLKRDIRRLIIGDEYDTTHRTSHKGIPHYDGLYDQSLYFDHTLTRYFFRKGWGISQFSLLRPLSELLIEKILAERYPELQALQMSCHAAHKKDERIYPCGRCEKCRRIVGMLLAIGSDPGQCGYSSDQIEACKKALVSRGTHQERAGGEHLAFLLKSSHLLETDRLGKLTARERPEVMQLRFDPERAPFSGIPTDLREGLYRIYLEHVSRSVLRSGRTWRPIDLLHHPGMRDPYPFEMPEDFNGNEREKIPSSKTQGSDFLLGEFTWPEAKKRFRTVDVALLPVGAIEQHGPHLPLDADAFDAEYLTRKVAEACTPPRPIVLPLISYGVSYHHEDFAGTISINPETLSQLVYDIGMSAVRHGITKLVIINGHGGNSPALHFAAQMINRDARIFTCVDTGETSDPDIYAMAETPNDVHSGEIETSTTLATRPHLVRLPEAQEFIPRFSSRYLDFSSKRSVGWYALTSKISPSGVMGDPTKGSREKGERMWDVMIHHLVEFVEELKRLSLDEIYQKRY